MHIVNIIARSLVALVGLGIAFGLDEVLGSVVFLFGLYRLITYLQKRRSV